MKVYVYNAKRSPIGKFKKSFCNTDILDISSQVGKTLIKESTIDTSSIDEVVIGNVLSAGLGQNIARQIQLGCDIPNETCAFSINMVCGSGMKALNIAFNDIKLGKCHCVMAGGVENMSKTPLLSDRYNEETEKKDHMLYDSLTDAFSKKHMGLTAENVAKEYKISREEQDQFAFDSQMKTKNAQEKNVFSEEIVKIKNVDGEIIEKDEFPRNDTTLEKLASLKTAFMEDGTVTAGNASGINDGAALLILGDDNVNAKPLVEVVDFAQQGCDPSLMGMGPYYAVSKLLKANNLTLNDIDLLEVNEAFASQSIAVLKNLANDYKIDYKELLNKTNVNGGALALGHPVGASGARIVTTLIYEMKRRKTKYGIASLCIGGGMGIAMLLKNVED